MGALSVAVHAWDLLKEVTIIFGLLWWLRQSRICLQFGRPGFKPWVGKIPWKRERLPTPVYLPGESHAQRSLARYGSWGHKESDTTEQLTLSLFTLLRARLISKLFNKYELS